jgi:two-component system sensor histidine kinase VicK
VKQRRLLSARRQRRDAQQKLDELLEALRAARDGDLHVRLPAGGNGTTAELAVAFNELADRREALGEYAVEIAIRQDFVATVSHELKQPIAAIYGAALTLQRDEIKAGDMLQDTLLDVITEEANQLKDIVANLLLASQLDSGKLQLHLESCDPRELVRLELDAMQTHLPENVELALDAPRELPSVAVDSGQLRQVISNLLENAVKYSPDGGIVTVELARRDHHVRFSVSDNGLGIPPAEHRRIFEKFFRLGPELTRGVNGTGLGLYICRELVRRVNGRIWVESDGHTGSTFHVEIPNGRVPASRRRTVSAA